jgi:hypothetical protein
MRTGTLVVELVVVRCRARPTQLRAEQLSRGGIIHEYLGIPIIPSFYGPLLLNLRGVGLVVELISELDDRLSLVKLRASQKEWVKITGPCFNRCSPQWMDWDKGGQMGSVGTDTVWDAGRDSETRRSEVLGSNRASNCRLLPPQSITAR